MSETTVRPAVHCANTRDHAVFGTTGPQPHFLLDSELLTVVVVGLESGQQIPSHPESAAVYHFLEGAGTMWVDGVGFDVQPGATVITPHGAARGVQATTRMVFLATKVGLD